MREATSFVSFDDQPLDEWMHAIAKGDEGAFLRFYQAYSPRVYSFALHLNNGNEVQARELHQTVFIKAARSFKVFPSERQLWGWLCAIARNAHVDGVRRSSVFSRFLQVFRSNASTSLDDQRADDHLHIRLEQALKALDADDLALVELVYFKGQTQEAAAEHLGKTTKAVERKLARIRQLLREEILKGSKNGI